MFNPMRVKWLTSFFGGFDPWLLGGGVLLTLGGLATLLTFGEGNFFFKQQLIWLVISLVVVALALIPDYRWLRSGHTTFFLYLIGVGFLVLTLFFGVTTKGCLLYTSPSPRDRTRSRMPSSA